MSSLLSSYLIDPVVRQARRFSSPAPSHDPTARLSHARDNAANGSLPAFLADLLQDNAVNQTDAHSNPSTPIFDDGNHVGAIVESPRSQSPDPEYMSSNPSYNLPERFRSGDTQSSARSSHNSMSTGAGDNQSRRSTRTDTQLGGVNYNTGNMSEALPADDGMRSLRQKIHKIREMEASSEEKARWMYMLMTKDYTASRAHLIRPISPSSIITHDTPGTPTTTNSEGFEELRARSAKSPPLPAVTSEADQDYNLSPEDTVPTYCPPSQGVEFEEDEVLDEEPLLGCEHYQRNVKIQCSACSRWYTCRFCHDTVEDHALNRPKTRNMFCMLCRTPQPAAGQCRDCGELAAWYYCDICKFWDNDSTKRIYHCPDCGICRKGEGLGKDFQHCKRCNVCISIRFASNHRCIEGATECDCPICGDYMFFSARSVVAMPCGHYMHSACHTKYMQSAYRCPICFRSAVNMELQWRKLDRAIEAQPMPNQFSRTTVQVQCNDCSAKSVGRYHWLGNKCGVCDSYNTNELRIIEADEAQEEVQSSSESITTDMNTLPSENAVAEMQDLTLVSSPSSSSAVPGANPALPPTSPPPPPDGESAACVDSANTSPRRPLRDLRPSRSYFLQADDADDRPRSSSSGGFVPVPPSETMLSFSPYEMLQRVSRSLSPIRYYLEGLGEEDAIDATLEIDDDDDEEEAGAKGEAGEDEDWDDAAVEDDEDDENEDSEVSVAEEFDGLDADEDDDDDDDEALDLPGHR